MIVTYYKSFKRHWCVLVLVFKGPPQKLSRLNICWCIVFPTQQVRILRDQSPSLQGFSHVGSLVLIFHDLSIPPIDRSLLIFLHKKHQSKQRLHREPPNPEPISRGWYHSGRRSDICEPSFIVLLAGEYVTGVSTIL